MHYSIGISDIDSLLLTVQMGQAEGSVTKNYRLTKGNLFLSQKRRNLYR